MSPPPLSLLIAIHNHQPDGNFGHVFAQAYDDCYRPLVDALLEAPHVRVALHHTGPLLEWIERERPDYFDKLRRLTERKQVELLGGGFYEPMLAVLPERDARGQIEMMAEYLESRFSVRPEGMWLAERVWEPSLAQLIAESGVKFTLVDDGHFRAAGEGGLLRGYYVTEKAGVPLALFPIDQSLRQAIPFLKAWETMDVLTRLAAETPPGLERAVTYGDDGEKFGVWPKTKEWVWGAGEKEGWLREFFRLLGERQGEVRTMHFGEYLHAHPPTGRIYLPTASYEEMGEWSLPAAAQGRYLEVRHSLAERGELDRARAFLHGGIWQNFLAKYPEANFMHKKMVLVSDKVARASAKEPHSPVLAHAKQELYRAQCNCCYWHGLFGGLYLNYLRDAVYHHLIEAEVQAERVLGAAPAVEVRDLDADLQPEVVLSSEDACAYVKPDLGGGVFELDFRPKRFNLLNVLGRREEGYHARLKQAAEAAHGGQQAGGGVQSIHDLVAVKSDGLADLLTYDQNPRLAFIDHFFSGDLTLDALARGRYQEHGDFAKGAYEIAQTQAGAVTLRRRGQVDGRAVTVEKRIALEGARLTASYRVSAPGEPFRVRFGCEVNLTLLAGDAPDRYYRAPGRELADRRLASVGETEGPIELVNEWDRFLVRLSAAPDTTLFRHPLETASQSEGGFERTYQGSVLTQIYREVELGEGRLFQPKITIEMVAL